MKLSPFLLTAMIAVPAAGVSAQAASPLPLDGLELLQKVAQRYRDAKSYSIASIEERSMKSEYVRQWTRTVLLAAEEPGGRSHFEGRGQFGDAEKISDGRTVWNYRATEHRYTMQAVAEIPAAKKPSPVGFSEMGIMQAQGLRNLLARSAESINSAQRLPDAQLVLNGHRYSCAVVHVRRSDLKRAGPDEKFDRTIWIDKGTQTILKVEEHSSGRLNGVEQESEVTTLYPRTILDSPLPDSLFVFSAPADAHQVKELPTAREEALGATLIGDRVPPLKLKAADGTVTPIESFRGKTVLIDLWATWCAPCVAALPQMAKLAQEGKDKGLVLIAIDRDQDAIKAAAYLKEKGLALTNFHDDGHIEAQLGSSPLPRDLIIDKEGWVVADGQWVARDGQLDENQLRARLAEADPALKDLLLQPAAANPGLPSK